MKLYYYRILGPEGRVRSGFVDLLMEREYSARLWLERQHNAVVLTLWHMPVWAAAVVRLLKQFFSQRLRPEDISGILRDLGLMLGAGVSMFEALQALQDELEFGVHPRVAGIIRHLQDDIESGASVSQAFDRHPNVFPETVRNLVRIGESTGNMDRMFTEGAEHIERITSIKKDIKTALIYPVFTFAAIIGAALFWVYYVVPNMSQLFKQMHAKLPPLTIGLVAFAEWLTDNAVLGLVLILVFFIGFWLVMTRIPYMRVLTYRLLHRLPITRVLITSAGLAHITEHLALLIKAGCDMVTSLTVLERATVDEYYRIRLNAIRQRVERGERLAPSMRREGGFPAMVVRMIGVGEDSGSLDTQLEHLSKEYRKRLDRLILSLAEIIKPAVILLAGGVFIFMLVALLLPVYDLVRQAVGSTMNGS